jgi:ribosomal protein S18 acetylase RimI-like enzyme
MQLEQSGNLKAEDIGMIRRLENKDIPTILKMDKELFPSNQQIPEKDLLADLKFSKTWVYETKHESKVVGALIATMEGMPYIYSIAVQPEYRGKFIATRLIHRFHKEYERYSYTHLNTDNQNPAQMLYFRLGYRVVGVDEEYYGEQTTALHMVRYKV